MFDDILLAASDIQFTFFIQVPHITAHDKTILKQILRRFDVVVISTAVCRALDQYIPHLPGVQPLAGFHNLHLCTWEWLADRNETALVYMWALTRLAHTDAHSCFC